MKYSTFSASKHEVINSSEVNKNSAKFSSELLSSPSSLTKLHKFLPLPAPRNRTIWPLIAPIISSHVAIPECGCSGIILRRLASCRFLLTDSLPSVNTPKYQRRFSLPSVNIDRSTQIRHLQSALRSGLEHPSDTNSFRSIRPNRHRCRLVYREGNCPNVSWISAKSADNRRGMSVSIMGGIGGRKLMTPYVGNIFSLSCSSFPAKTAKRNKC